jgi:arabinose-5-phosphate isomerase
MRMTKPQTTLVRYGTDVSRLSPEQTREARIRQGQSVIAIEAAALCRLRDTLDGAFADAVELLLTLPGRVIVTGIGKSGHIARKIAATLASTGTPALFVHPADALIMLSNSGGTTELKPMIGHAAALLMPIIAISSRRNSTLMRAATIRLLLPAAAEACPANIAPTTSTAMMLALGDALAMAAMHERGLSRVGFQALHPGGTLGLRLMRVAAVMHCDAEMPVVSADMAMREVVLTMTRLTFGIAGVVDGDGRLIGVITDGDLRRHVDALLTGTARDVMRRDQFRRGCAGADERPQDHRAVRDRRRGCGRAGRAGGRGDHSRFPAAGAGMSDARETVAIVVPARHASTRYPGKPLVAIRATPVVHRRLLDDQAAGRVGGTTVATAADGRALYFSKAVIPHVPDARIGDPALPVYLHVGVYAYRRAALARYARLPESALETLEGLEQLRFLDGGVAVRVVEVDPRGCELWELNNPSDLAPIEAQLAARGIA